MGYASEGWQYRAEFPISGSNTTGVKGGPHANFPLLINTARVATYASAIYSQARSDGGDIRVSADDAGATPLAIDLVSFSAGGATIELWAIDTSLPDAGHSVYVWWGKADATAPAVGDTYGRNAVWDDDLIRLHLQEAVNNDTDGYVDSTGNGNDGTGTSMAITAPSAKIGNGAEFDGSADYITIPSNFSPTSSWTISCWVKGDTFALDTDDRTILSQQDGTGTGRALLYVQASSSKPLSYIGGAQSLGLSALSTGAAYYLTVVYSSTANTVAIYIDNDAGNTTSSRTAEAATGNLLLAVRKATTTGHWDGWVDELVVRQSAISSDRRLTEYNNQSGATTFGELQIPVDLGGGFSLPVGDYYFNNMRP